MKLEQLEQKLFKEIETNLDNKFVDTLLNLDISELTKVSSYEKNVVDSNVNAMKIAMDNNLFHVEFTNVYNKIKDSNTRIYLLTLFLFGGITLESTNKDVLTESTHDINDSVNWFIARFLGDYEILSERDLEFYLIRAVQKCISLNKDISEELCSLTITDDSIEIVFFNIYSFSSFNTNKLVEEQPMLSTLKHFANLFYSMENNISI